VIVGRQCGQGNRPALAELTALRGRDLLADYEVRSLVAS